MQPKTNVKLDYDSFERIKKTALTMSKCNQRLDNDLCYHTELPCEIGLQLTNRCNLRCKHCFEWSENGYNHDFDHGLQAGELALELIEKVLYDTQKTNAGLFLWGGEPLEYSHWDKLADLILQYKRWSVLCTNGIDIINKMESILKASKHLAVLTSIEGFEDENDAIRGKGSFRRAMAGVKELVNLGKKEQFLGNQSVHCTISDAMIGKLYHFMEYMEDMEIDTLYYCFPWYIPEDIALKMDQYYNSQFKWMDIKSDKFSWHSFGFKLNENLLETLMCELEKINKRTWNIRIRYQPAVELCQVKDFVLGTEMAAQNKKRCLAVTNRMDVLADGSVSTCKLFKEFSVGNLYNQSVDEIWNGEGFNHVREILSNGLMPVCSKCVLLYLNGIGGRKYV